jgi:SRSO17 transposase
MSGTISLRDVRRWERELEQVTERFTPLFGRPEMRFQGAWYLRGLIAQVERKNGWQLAEYLGAETPTNLQHFIARSRWSADQVRDELLCYVQEQLSDPEGVLIVDETGFLKKGIKSAGVARMYSGTAGRIENCQIGVFLAYSSPRGHTLIDRELYLPRAWAEDAARCRDAHIPEDVAFATKPHLARQLLRRACAAGITAKWVCADEVYGSDSQFRSCCEELGLGYVVAVKSDAQLFHNGQRGRISDHVVEFTKRQWQRLSCGKGTKGERFYDWASLSWPGSPESPFIHGLLVRRSISDPTDLAYFFTSAPRGTELQQLVLIAGRRWAIEECFEQAKQLTGLDEYEVRSWVGWYRHITLSMLAHAALAVMRAQSSRTTVLKKVPGG